MTKLKNPWFGYLDRSLEQLMAKAKVGLKIFLPELTDQSPSDPLMIVIENAMGAIENLNLYVDSAARESFLSVCLRRVSAIRNTRIIDYRIKGRYPESVDVRLSLLDDTLSIPTPVSVDTVIPQGIILQGNGKSFMVIESQTIPVGEYSIILRTQQVTVRTAVDLGTTTGLGGQAILLGGTLVDNSVSLLINGDTYRYVESLGYSKSTDKDFTVQIREDNQAYIVLGNNIYGATPGPSLAIVGEWRETLGPAGKIGPDVDWESSDLQALLGEPQKFKLYNEFASSGGAVYETLDQIKINAPASIRTMERPVSYQDFIDVAKLFPGVAQAGIDYSCGKSFDIYIYPSGGGVAQLTLREAFHNYLYARNRKIIG